MASTIAEKVKAAGVIGAGGAGFPTHLKISSPVSYVIVNGAECEPLLKVDQQLLEYKTAEILKGLSAVREATGAKEAFLAVKGKYKGALKTLEKEIRGQPVKIKILDDFYPAGDEHVLVYETLGSLVPQGGIPLKAGAVVVNVETLLNVAKSLEDIPVTQTYITVCGEVSRPLTCSVPVGLSVREVLHLAGAGEEKDTAVIEGGPMMGKVLSNLDHPVTKTTKGLIVLPREHPVIKKKTMSLDKIARQARTSCIQCRFCTDLCPRYLLGHRLKPHEIMAALRHPHFREETLKMALLCSECGACEQYACLLKLSPRLVNAFLKQELASKGLKPPEPLAQKIHPLKAHRKIPVRRLLSRLGLALWDLPAPLTEVNINPDKVVIPLKQHVGVPAVPVVKVGERVAKGQLLADIPPGKIGAAVHASIGGLVAQISDTEITIASEKGCGL